ncbi:LuxR C-terminal-related transcriptional regulator [Spirillospora sp. NPDC049652]
MRTDPRVLLAGRWTGPFVAALRSSCTLVGGVADAPDWIVATSDGVPAPEGGAPSAERRVAAAVRGRVAPGIRLAAVDGDGDPRSWAGCDLYLAAPVEPEELAAALWLADRGFTLSRPPAVPSGLTPREKEVLALLRAGYGNVQIARSLVISRSTVEFHLTRIFKKLGVVSRAEAIARAGRHAERAGVP